jgi:hypothetical protein
MGHSVIEAASLSEARGLTDLPGLTLILSDHAAGRRHWDALLDPACRLLLMTALPPGDPRGSCPLPGADQTF